jgi:hypothetical protein
MHSTASTFPRVGARCYPPFLGITKEMMSQGPQVADMEYQEENEKEGGPIIPHITIRRWKHHPPHPSWPTEENKCSYMR